MRMCVYIYIYIYYYKCHCRSVIKGRVRGHAQEGSWALLQRNIYIYIYIYIHTRTYMSLSLSLYIYIYGRVGRGSFIHIILYHVV